MRESCVVEQRDPGPAFADGMMWASRITTVALGFSLPPLFGFALDRWWGTIPVATMIGAVLGFTSGMLQIMRLARDLPGGKNQGKSRYAGKKQEPILLDDSEDPRDQRKSRHRQQEEKRDSPKDNSPP
jgi:hypothetical protein